jgi:DNA-binding IclR family transcriptional regulator
MRDKMAVVGSTSRVLAIIKALSVDADEGLTTQAVIERSGVPASTVYRLLAELEENGLVYRTEDRRVRANFSFERRLWCEHISPARLSSACAWLSDTLQTASEIIVFQQPDLVWHEVRQHPSQAIRLRAHTGYVRQTYELDSITRMALAHCPIEFIARHWDKSGFYEVGVAGSRVDWGTVQTLLEGVDHNGMQFDLQGNAKGVRRFCVAVRDGQRIACLLTVAEAATPLRDETSHIERIRQMLTEQRDVIESAGPAAPVQSQEVGAA